ncbi:MAG: asparagine synthase (glutamine-hydrolysing) [Gammaproteobacteria bacterium]|nr:MAG: asparagine synthase (glutamine-hydrolysing) [Gammaproteobacteria bacterium]TND04512.1 MAG: asparagine synthase (glutamine-hydrolysing) [Gammaproteobacteria bacterium]
MTDVLWHRGPDGSGYEFYPVDNAHIGLGHRRLSIIDLSAGAAQPLKDESGDHVIAFNGEIYNYVEIREELKKEGFTFFTSSDTEVLLKAYIRWGVDAVHKLIGMFAFIIYDKKKEKLYLFRDRAGVKPLYYSYKDGLFLFASELKAFHQTAAFKKEIDADALPLFFRFGYVPAPYTIFKNTYKLKPGHYLTIDLNSRDLKEEKYWDVIDYYNMPLLDISEPDAVDEMEKLLVSAFRYRMVADVPVGVFLSGGYDSTAVTALLQTDMTDRLKTFTIGFDDKRHNEANEAKAIAAYLGTDHTEYYCSEADAKEIVSTLPYYYDEPFIDTSAIPTMLVSRMARENVTVALSADGGDETFVGYDHTEEYVDDYHKIRRYPPWLRRSFNASTGYLSNVSKSYRGYNKHVQILLNQFWKLRSRCSVDQLIDIFLQGRCTDYRIYRLLNTTVDTKNAFFNNATKLSGGIDDITKSLAIDYQNYMVDDVLTKVDRATMSVSLEGREPLLDHRIIEFAARLPLSYKYGRGNRKKILKKIVHRHVPSAMMDRPKKGFGVPVYKWLRGDLSKLLLYHLEEPRLREHGFFDVEYVTYLKNRYLKDGSEYNIVWTILVFQMWYQKWIKDEGEMIT